MIPRTPTASHRALLLTCLMLVASTVWADAVLTDKRQLFFGTLQNRDGQIVLKLEFGEMKLARESILWYTRAPAVTDALSAARLLAQQERLPLAVMAYQQAIQREPQNRAEAQRELIDITRKLGDADNAAAAPASMPAQARPETVTTPPVDTGLPSFEQVNRALGINVFVDTSLWDDDPEEVGRRLRWPRISQTPRISSYRLYPSSSAQVLGSRPFSLALFAAGKSVEEISIVFVNKGDFPLMYQPATPIADNSNERAQRRAQEEMMKSFREILARDSDALIARLRDVFGDYQRQSHSQGGKMRTRLYRWDWHQHSFLLISEEDEYVCLRIVPRDIADERGRARKTVSDGELRTELRSRVQRRENGDVIITGIPMVDQGPKGYCVPATWERCLRYMGMQADMYLLAMAGDTAMGGGTSSSSLREGVHKFVHRNGRSIRSFTPSLATRNVDRYIDDGLPIMWSMLVISELDQQLSLRMQARRQMQDTTAWNDRLRDVRKAARQINREDGGGHMCMIIGYNKLTNELCISDSWGPSFAERWITVEEAEAISLNSADVVAP